MKSAATSFMFFIICSSLLSPVAHAALPPNSALSQETASSRKSAPVLLPGGGSTSPSLSAQPSAGLSLKERLQARMKRAPAAGSASLIFDLPVTYNRRVSFWISHFQDKGKAWFRDWLERSTKYMPFIQKELKNAGLPQDLAFMVMIESGFLPNAVSHAEAVGPWQFISATGQRYGLKQAWWIDERRDLKKSTLAAIKYLKDLHQEFGSWYLVAASYNMGEGGLRRQIKKYNTKDFWTLAKLGALPKETTDYVPKILAAMMIAKSPSLYGFRDLSQFGTLEYELVSAPGGTDLKSLADQLGITVKSLKDLNAELVLGYVPTQVPRHFIRVPKGSTAMVDEFLRQNQ
ncbi:MAG: lytic transglycosylase domain-containing protein [Pseudobdellovibrionaceae bacterium]